VSRVEGHGFLLQISTTDATRVQQNLSVLWSVGFVTLAVKIMASLVRPSEQEIILLLRLPRVWKAKKGGA